MKVPKMLGLLMLSAVTIVASSGMLSAHHSRAQYGNDEMTTTGTVVEYQWRNPHVYVVWEVKEQGKSGHWVGEMASVTSMIADGMTKTSLKPGDKITVSAFPSKLPGSTEALVKKITKEDGTVVIDNSRAPNLRQP